MISAGTKPLKEQAFMEVSRSLIIGQFLAATITL
jgi:hypothetical protein